MIKTDILVVGAGPAGMAASLKVASYGAKVLLVERDGWFGGQLVKQTHRFFGSKREYAGIRGIDIANIFSDEIKQHNKIKPLLNTAVLGAYDDGVFTAAHENRMLKIKPKATIIATGASERMIPFVNNDLPGVYGAGAVQTLMNLHGVLPGQNVLMVGAGNIGLIVSYQLMQAGVNVTAIIEGMPHVGGYWVHAAKVRRLGIPILTRHTIMKAAGKDKVEGAVVAQIDAEWQVVPGTEREIEVDTICLAVGLSPLIEILAQLKCPTVYSGSLGGYVPLRNKYLEVGENIFIAGDAAGIEEATSAILEGQLVGSAAADGIGFDVPASHIADINKKLNVLRAGPVSIHVRQGLEMLRRCTLTLQETNPDLSNTGTRVNHSMAVDNIAINI